MANDRHILRSTEQVAVLVVTAVLCVAVPVAARAHPGPRTRAAARVLAAVLLVWFAAYHLIVALQGSYALDFDLPLHLTDAVTVIAALALWRPRMLLRRIERRT